MHRCIVPINRHARACGYCHVYKKCVLVTLDLPPRISRHAGHQTKPEGKVFFIFILFAVITTVRPAGADDSKHLKKVHGSTLRFVREASYLKGYKFHYEVAMVT